MNPGQSNHLQKNTCVEHGLVSVSAIITLVDGNTSDVSLSFGGFACQSVLETIGIILVSLTIVSE